MVKVINFILILFILRPVQEIPALEALIEVVVVEDYLLGGSAQQLFMLLYLFSVIPGLQVDVPVVEISLL